MPATHGWQVWWLVAAGVDENSPAAHRKQTDVPVCDVHEPGKQAKQLVAPLESEKVPTAHFRHTAELVAPMTDEYVPARQPTSHDAAPGVEE